MSKLNSYCKEWDSCYETGNFFPDNIDCYKYLATYSFNSIGLVIIIKSEGKYNNKTRSSQEVVTVPIYDFKDLYDNRTKLHIYTSNSTVIKKREDGAQEVTSFEIVGFKGNAETDLALRMERAFNHLKRFYTKPKTTEPF